MDKIPDFNAKGEVIGNWPQAEMDPDPPPQMTLADPMRVVSAWLLSGPLTPLVFLPLVVQWFFNPSSNPYDTGLPFGLFFFTVPSTIGISFALNSLRRGPFPHSDASKTVWAWAFRTVPIYSLLAGVIFTVMVQQASMLWLFVTMFGLVLGWPFAVVSGLWSSIVVERLAIAPVLGPIPNSE